jgi:hypothetical protein
MILVASHWGKMLLTLLDRAVGVEREILKRLHSFLSGDSTVIITTANNAIAAISFSRKGYSKKARTLQNKSALHVVSIKCVVWVLAGDNHCQVNRLLVDKDGGQLAN